MIAHLRKELTSDAIALEGYHLLSVLPPVLLAVQPPHTVLPGAAQMPRPVRRQLGQPWLQGDLCCVKENGLHF